MKRLGCCTLCETEVYEVKEYLDRPDSPRHGHPCRLGPLLENGTQVVFQMSDGSEAAITFCVPCAGPLTAADYPGIWQIVCESNAISLAGRPRNEQIELQQRCQALYPVALLCWRREDPEAGRLTMDRRGPAHA